MLWSSPSLQLLRPAALSCSGLRRGRLLRGLSLRVPAGMRLLIVADPEASGRALVRILAGLARRGRGHVEIAGVTDPSAEGWGRRVAHLGPEPGIHAWMTPREALALAAGLLELDPDEADRRIADAIEWCRIPAAAVDEPVRRGGAPLLQRTGLAASLLVDPEVLLLDEPLRALDAAERWALLDIAGTRRTMLLASRYPSSELGVVSHVALVREGRVAFIAPTDEVTAAGRGLTMSAMTDFADRQAAASLGGGGATPAGQTSALR